MLARILNTVVTATGFVPMPLKHRLNFFGTIINLGAVAAVIWLLIQPDGELAMFGCRIFAAFGVLLMIFSVYRMIETYNQKKIKTFNDEKPIPVIMGFFVSFMTLISLYGYFSKISKIIIFRNFDFVLRYKNKFFELIMDMIYIPAVCCFLIVQLLYFFIVAQVNGISDFDKWVLCPTLFTNALQKWLFESTVEHMELCEEFHKKGNLCSKYMNYTTSYENLTKAQEEYYFTIKENEPFTYTVTMELFVACIGLIFFFKAHMHKHEILPQVEEEVKPHSRFAWIFITFLFLVIFIGPLYIIVAAPIINVTPECTWLRDSRNYIRCITHLANVLLLFYIKSLFKISIKPKAAAEADIIIMWVAGIVNLMKAALKLIINCSFLCLKMSGSDAVLFIIAQFGNGLESFSFYLLIFVVERLLLIVNQPDSDSTRKHLSKFTLTFVPLYFCASLIGFAAYYNLNALRFFPDGVKSAVGINLIVFIQATYPTSMLFTMTVCLCMASIMEKLYQKNYYRLKGGENNV